MSEERSHYDAAAAAEWAQSVGLFAAPPRYVPAPVTTIQGDKHYGVTIHEDGITIWRNKPAGKTGENVTQVFVDYIPLEGLRLCRRIE